ncbi:hypothetical protein RFI_24363 [Reticulomyxa filosa]|uniref:Exocyst complex component Sec10-like alpha-helical bundle domain-containing protein n=1 Tax=Reticulomyxa filosa TaxID=46433 RepID=X6MHW0_RETFI|nr:hypothetical protein RFI_24363 [Reticulomyxa filosa]|eukprot:ETO13012.1 hypothetical protein RFI_24363 [Reticulomyxa filosa]
MKEEIWSKLIRSLNLEDQEDIEEEISRQSSKKSKPQARKLLASVNVMKGEKEKQMQFDRLQEALDTKVNELIPHMCRSICHPNVQQTNQDMKVNLLLINTVSADRSSKTFEDMLSHRLQMENSKGVLDRLADIYSLPLFTNGEKLSEHAHALFMLLLDTVEDMLLRNLLPLFRALCRATLPKTHPAEIKNWHYFDAVKTINGGVQLLEEFFVNFVLPHMSDMNEQSVCVDTKNAKYANFEKEILSGLQHLLQASVNYIAKILKDTQKKTDYRPKMDDTLEKTQTCRDVVAFLTTFRKKAIISLDGRNLDRFFLIFGTRFHHALVVHLKKMQVSELGCMILTQDLKEYRDTMASFHIERVDELFLNLVEKVQLLGVPPESVQDLIHQAKWSGDLDDIMEWLKVRTDYKTAKLG